MGGLLDAFGATGVDPDKIRRFLEGEPDRAGGSIRDRIAADMTNELLGALGQAGRQSGEEVKRLRQRGLWKTFDQRPE